MTKGLGAERVALLLAKARDAVAASRNSRNVAVLRRALASKKRPKK